MGECDFRTCYSKCCDKCGGSSSVCCDKYAPKSNATTREAMAEGAATYAKLAAKHVEMNLRLDSMTDAMHQKLYADGGGSGCDKGKACGMQTDGICPPCDAPVCGRGRHRGADSAHRAPMPPAKRVVKQVEYVHAGGSKQWLDEPSGVGHIWTATGRTHSYEVDE